MRGGAVAARRAHNPKVAGSSPAPATLKDHVKAWSFVLTCAKTFEWVCHIIKSSPHYIFGVFYDTKPEYA